MNTIYCDYAATAPLRPEVRATMADADDRLVGNPSSVHRSGQAARVALERARKVLARALGALPREVILTSGGTESNNLALLGLFDGETGPLKPGDHVVTSMIEHPSVRRPLERLAEWGVKITAVAPEPTGEVSPEGLARAIQPRTRLISVMSVNNETGVMNDVQAVGALAVRNGILFHTDAVQAFGKLPINVADSGIHFLSASAHKIGGPRGMGLLYARKDKPLRSLHLGGSQENNHRAGTENVAGAVGFACAAGIALDNRQELVERLADLRHVFLAELDRDGTSFQVNGANGYAGIVNLRFPGLYAPATVSGYTPGQSLMMNLDLSGVAASFGSACASGSVEPSAVLMAMGLSREQAAESVRFSFGYATTEQEVVVVARTVARVLEELARTGQATALPA